MSHHATPFEDYTSSRLHASAADIAVSHGVPSKHHADPPHPWATLYGTEARRTQRGPSEVTAADGRANKPCRSQPNKVAAHSTQYVCSVVRPRACRLLTGRNASRGVLTGFWGSGAREARSCGRTLHSAGRHPAAGLGRLSGGGVAPYATLEHMRTVGTHYGPTRMHRAYTAAPSEGWHSWHSGCYSLVHWIVIT